MTRRTIVSISREDAVARAIAIHMRLKRREIEAHYAAMDTVLLEDSLGALIDIAAGGECLVDYSIE